MAEAVRTVLKKGQVKLGEPYRLGGGAAGAPGSSGARARVVEQGDAGALIEVVCACGRKTYLRCDYAPAEQAPGEASQKGE